MLETVVSRRSVLRGGFKSTRGELRPPWAVPAANFAALCTGCDSCRTACPEKVIAGADGEFPRIDFSAGQCTFCAACVEACDEGALQRPTEAAPAPPWQIELNIAGSCLDRRGIVCRACSDHCDQGAIRFRPLPGGLAEPLVEMPRCTGCGACVAPCPVQAIAVRGVASPNSRIQTSSLQAGA
ncbi:MAG: ferredoxin-type protein NapF [Alphaproteobacteria bacterium]|jgi:ferredoxin-type protein NapF|nr:ferredoxin-type protein NapF [Alphaproteobacteria bacterium]